MFISLNKDAIGTAGVATGDYGMPTAGDARERIQDVVMVGARKRSGVVAFVGVPNVSRTGDELQA